MALQLTGRTALVTGSFRGTGAVIAARLAQEGAHVLVHGTDAGTADAVVASIVDTGARATAVWGDLTAEAGAQICAAQVAEHGTIDILVNNLGGVVEGKWFSGDLSVWDEAWNYNVVSGVRMVRACVPGMRVNGWGRVVFVSTVGATRPSHRTPHYYAAKAALPNLGLSLAKELSGSGVTVNTVSPGLLRTPEVEAWLRERAKRKNESLQTWEEIECDALADIAPNLCGRLGRPEDVAAAVAFLVSEDAAFINATHLRVDGGASDHVQ
ncbi:MAG: 3-oxoacyl-[acyl-carrier protein] reductase [Hyphomicrobiaceae bacterium]|jgi:3-oxoacyl-[acyl-carrier protein] reductase